MVIDRDDSVSDHNRIEFSFFVSSELQVEAFEVSQILLFDNLVGVATLMVMLLPNVQQIFFVIHEIKLVHSFAVLILHLVTVGVA